MNKVIYYSNFSEEQLNTQLLKWEGTSIEKPLLVLLPNRELLQKKRKQWLQLDNASQVVVFQTFDDIVNNIMTHEFPKVISETFQVLILKKVCKKLSDSGNLHYFKEVYQQDGVLISILDGITRLKSHSFFPKDIPNGTKVLQDISLIYGEYENFLEEHDLYDREKLYQKALKKLKESPSQYGSVILDYFFDLRYVEISLLEIFLGKKIPVEVRIPMRNKYNNPIPEQMIHELEKIGFKFIDYRSGKEENIQVNAFVASSERDEIQWIFGEIKKKLEMGNSYDDIGIVYCEEQYVKKIVVYGEQVGIPIDTKYTKSLAETPLGREFLNLMEFVLQPTLKLLKERLRSHYFSIGDIPIKKMEKLINSFPLSNPKDILLKILQIDEIEISLEEYERIEEMAKDFLEEIQNFEGNCFSIENLFHFFQQFSLQKTFLEDFTITEDSDLLERDFFCFEGIQEIFTEIMDINKRLGPLTREELIFALKDTVSLKNIPISKNNYGIRLYSSTEMFGVEKEHIFLCGANATYPKKKEENFLKARGFFHGLEMEKCLGREKDFTWNNELKKLIDLFLNTKKSITIFYTKVDTEDTGSLLVDKCLNLLNKNIVYKEIKRDTKNFQSSLEKYLLSLLILHDEENHTEEISLEKDKIPYIYLLENLLKRKEMDSMKEYHGYFDSKESQLRNEKAPVYSFSMIEDYLNCPYYYYLKRILKLEETKDEYEEEEYSLLGNIFHRTLELYYSNYIEKYPKRIKPFREELLKDAVKKALLQENLSDNNYLESYLLVILKDFLLADIQREETWDTGFYPKYLEKSINFAHRDYKFTGRIDRIDTDGKGREIVIDYKSSSTSVPSEKKFREEERHYQIPIYEMGRKKEGKKVVAGEYGIVKTGEFKCPMRNKEEFTNFKEKKTGFTEEELTDLMNKKWEEIYSIVQKIEEGNFPVEPEKCLESNCPYNRICRIEEEEE